jgi:CspA family cold shock protein
LLIAVFQLYFGPLAVEQLSHVGIGRHRRSFFFEDVDDMAEGTIKRLTDKGFGFINTGGPKDLFFHSSDLEEVRYDDLREGQKVSFNEGMGPKGPRAENVRVL